MKKLQTLGSNGNFRFPSLRGNAGRQFLRLPFFLALFIIGILSGASLAQEERAVIQIPSEATISSDRVELSAIAKISAPDAVTAEKLKHISLGYAPQPGSVREIGFDRIVLGINAAGFSSSEFSLHAPALVRIRRAAQTVEEDLIRTEIEKAVLANLQAAGADAKIVRLDLPANLNVPSGKISVKANAGTIRNLAAPFSVGLEIRVDEKVVRRLSIMVEVEATAPVLVTKRNLPANTPLREDMVKTEIRKLTRPMDSYLTDLKKLRGVIAQRTLPEGAEITTDSIVSGIVVKTGDSVQVIGESDRIKLSIAGEARASGRIGDRISVKNSQSGALLQAVVIDEGRVQVRF